MTVMMEHDIADAMTLIDQLTWCEIELAALARADPDAGIGIELRLPRSPLPVPRDDLAPIQVAARPRNPPRPHLVVRAAADEPALTPRVERWGASTVAAYRHRPSTGIGPDGLPERPAEDSGSGPDDGGMDPRLTCGMLAMAALEVISGTRPLAQLARWVSPAIFATLEQRRLLGSGADGAPPEPMLARAVSGQPRPTVQRVRAMRVDELTIESSVVLRHADRVRAVAIRLVRVRGCWRAEALVVG